MPSKTKPKAAKKTAMPVLQTLGQGGPGQDRNKSVIRILLAVVVVVCGIEAYNMFQGTEVPKDFKVQPLLKVVGEEKPCGHFTAWGIAPIGKDKFVVTDQENCRLLIFDRQGNFLKAIGKRGTGPTQFQEPSGMAWDTNGNAYVMDTWNGAIKGFDEKGKEVMDLDLTKFKNFYGPRGVEYDGHEFIISDTGNHRVVLMTADGTIEAAWGASAGSGPGQFKGPLAAAGDGKGNYYVADSDNDRLQWLDKDGKDVKIYKYAGSVWAVAVDQEGRFYVSTTENNGCVKVYSPKGGYLGDLKDTNGSADPFRGVRWISIGPDDTLMITVGTTASLFKIPAQTN